MKPKVLLISGWGFPADSLSGIAREIGPRADIRLFSVHDLLASPASSDSPDYASALLSHLRSEGRPAVLAGWSLGGMVAVEAAAQADELVAGLVLYGSSARFCVDEPPGLGIPRPVLRTQIQRLSRDPEASIRDFMVMCAEPHALSRAELQQRVDGAMKIGIDSLRAGLIYLRDTDLRLIEPRSHHALCVVQGEADRIVPWQGGEELAALRSDATFIMRSGMGHDLPLRDPGFAAIPILEILETVWR